MSDWTDAKHDHYPQCRTCRWRFGSRFSIGSPCMDEGKSCAPSLYQPRDPPPLTSEEKYNRAVNALRLIEEENTTDAINTARECLDELEIYRSVD